MKKKLLALLLCAALLLSVSTGCNLSTMVWVVRLLREETQSAQVTSSEVPSHLAPFSSPSPSSSEKPEAPADTAGMLVTGDFFPDDVWHADVDYEDIQYAHYELEEFEALAEELLEALEADPTRESFDALDSQLTWEMEYIYTLYVRIEVDYMTDPGVEWVAEEYAYTESLWYDAYDVYLLTMQTVAQEYPELMRDAYGEDEIEEFTDYDSGDGSDTELLLRESELVQEYYVLVAERRPDYDRLTELFVELVAVRQELAALYGYESYADYAYESLYSREYAPEDVQPLWESVKQYVTPVLQEYSYTAGEVYGLDYSPEAILQAMDTHLQSFSPEVYEAFAFMVEHGLYEIDPVSTKNEIGYTTSLEAFNQPFIFNSPYGEWYDYTTMFHEFGHFLSRYYTTGDLLFGTSDNDLCELQSQGMEVMFTLWYEDIAGARSVPAAECDLLCNLLYSVHQGAMYDEFQQRVYAEEDLTPEKVQTIFKETYLAYGGSTYHGYEYEWIHVLHNFEYPFYYISYGVSAVPALEIYARLQENPATAAATYLTVVAADPEEYSLSEALEEAGLRDVFAPDTLAEISAGVEATLREIVYG